MSRSLWLTVLEKATGGPSQRARGFSVANVKLRSCTEHRSGQGWYSGFADGSHDAIFGLRQHLGLFAEPAPSTPELATSLRIGRAYFGGVLFPYYGHFVIESLCQLPNIPHDGAPIVFMTLNNTVTDWQTEFFRDIGLASRIVTTKMDSWLEVGELVRVDQSNIIRTYISHAYVCRMASYFRRSTMPQRKVYISRVQVKNAPVAGEIELQSRLRDMGFEIVTPEAMSIRRQAETYDDAALIVAIEGSALHTLVFTTTPKTVIILRRRKELDINFRLQFALQPQIKIIELGCMRSYADDYFHPAELDVEMACSAVREVLSRRELGSPHEVDESHRGHEPAWGGNVGRGA